MNHLLYRLSFLLLAALIVPGCYTATRIERELYTITQRDTTVRETPTNVPGERDNGTIYPSSRQVEITRRYEQHDSTVERYYPAFLRFGGVEAASFIGTGGNTNGSGLGLFGLYDLLTIKRTTDTKTFTGNMYRFMPYEWRLRWFDDAPDWTFGISAVEMFIKPKDSSATVSKTERLMGIGSPYIRKRLFLRSDPPYVMVVPFIGVGLLPSQYLNVGATFDIGSYGGFNLRAYGGFITGSTAIGQEKNNRTGTTPDYSVSFPYFGIGVSALDFVNKTDELFVEWKDHKHNAIEVSALDLAFAYSTTANAGSWFNSSASDSATSFPSGFILRFATASFPLPVADGHLYVGTSLFNGLILSKKEIAIGWLPLRVGYRLPLIGNDMNLEPFAELNYYPKTTVHLGARLAVKLPEIRLPGLNFPVPLMASAMAGYVNGSANSDIATGYEDLIAPQDFSSFYLGIGVGIGDVFHTPKEVLGL